MNVQCREPLVTDMHSLEFPWMAAAMLGRRRSNLLVLCRDGEPDGMLAPMMAFCRRPVQVCRLPGALTLPDDPNGTLVLMDVGALLLGQQMKLYDWLEGAGRECQVVSIARESVYPLVEEGRFMEALYYRLNVVSLGAGQPF
jgi:transcriptional regulator of aromatic amino acid metabolism